MRTKLRRFAEIKENTNVLEEGKEMFTEIKGKWNECFFHNDNDIVVELGCGRGEYTVGLAEHFPDKNFVGMDIKGERIWKGSTSAIEKGLSNVGFLRTIIQLMENFFVEDEIAEIWVTFPDPRPKERDIKRRLTSPRFMRMYEKLLKKDGWVKFKTDNTALFDYTLNEVLPTMKIKDLVYTKNLYSSDLHQEHFSIKTKYEKLFYDKGENIKYLKFKFDS